MNELLDKLRAAVAKLHSITGPPFGLKFEDMTITMSGPDAETLIRRLEQAQAAEGMADVIKKVIEADKDATRQLAAIMQNGVVPDNTLTDAMEQALAAYTQSASQEEGK